jgi:N-acetylmuramoyl-L-alanine amidase-like protein
VQGIRWGAASGRRASPVWLAQGRILWRIAFVVSALVVVALTAGHTQPAPNTNGNCSDVSISLAAAPTSGTRLPDADSLARKIATVSARYLGARYVRDPLGEGPGMAPDTDPLFCRDGVDCQTFVEQVLAEALARRPQDLVPLLTRIRYKGGQIGFATRNHYMVSDWLPRNRWLIRDLTGTIGGSKSRVMTKVIDRAAFFRSRGAPELGQGIAPEVSRTLYLPRASVSALEGRIPNGAVLIWLQDRPGIMAAHCGLAVRRADGALIFRHASELRGRVLDEPLRDYLQRASSHIVGVKVCQAVAPLDTHGRHR